MDQQGEKKDKEDEVHQPYHWVPFRHRTPEPFGEFHFSELARRFHGSGRAGLDWIGKIIAGAR